MAKMIFGFIALFVLVLAIIQAWTAATGREKIQLISSLGYATMITALVLLIIATIVVLF